MAHGFVFDLLAQSQNVSYIGVRKDSEAEARESIVNIEEYIRKIIK